MNDGRNKLTLTVSPACNEFGYSGHISKNQNHWSQCYKVQFRRTVFFLLHLFIRSK